MNNINRSGCIIALSQLGADADARLSSTLLATRLTVICCCCTGPILGQLAVSLIKLPTSLGLAAKFAEQMHHLDSLSTPYGSKNFALDGWIEELQVAQYGRCAREFHGWVGHHPNRFRLAFFDFHHRTPDSKISMHCRQCRSHRSVSINLGLKSKWPVRIPMRVTGLQGSLQRDISD
ncbi:hypothetical protein BO94DRAFT_305442 [Aspergillus sclerotioniger CBS 115572]|uniref:Uncharacterized protein n=1 Tax=Aspergillus sclerotioniger CBS 115572 TaxID=1450535 RepID=A0A317V0X8_9EURO|nr:hypothetical protein BO94DRAFT_305442 [Aspergillus sclerotioniger CBS 115572]PWY67984.1 hypothetical protein BO94DRAFT_305442 [Aspergillus sclerotioniger CBS 115572]